MKKRNLILFSAIIFIVIGIFAFIKSYIPYDTNKKMYKIIEGKYFDYYSYTKENKDEIKKLNEYIDSIYLELLNKFELSNIEKVEVRVFEDSNKMLNLVNQTQGNTIGMANSLGIQMVLDKNRDMKTVFKHEFIHMLIMNRNSKDTKVGDYAWLNEGIADYYATSDKNKDRSVRVAAMTNNLPDLDLILSDSSEDEADIVKEWGYSLYRSIIAFIADKYGEKQMINIVDEIGQSNLYDILNLNKEDFYLEWQKFILDNY